jgi:hypothetical protein
MNGKRILSHTFLTILIATGAETAQRTFVSAGQGSDANLCTRLQPCRNFAAALLQTDPGGEVVVLDSGGYGVVTITQSVSLISPTGVYAGLTAATVGAAAIRVDGDGLSVIVRGLSMNGLGVGWYGVQFTGAQTASNTSIHVENCVLSGFEVAGLHFDRNGSLFVRGTMIRKSGRLADINGGAIYIHGGSELSAFASIDQTYMDANQNGLIVGRANVTVRNSVASANAGKGFWVGGGVPGTLMIDASEASGNGDRGFCTGPAYGELDLSNSIGLLNGGGDIVASAGRIRVSQTMGGVFIRTGGEFLTYRNNVITNYSSGTITPITPD